jgi:hypothetical protein
VLRSPPNTWAKSVMSQMFELSNQVRPSLMTMYRSRWLDGTLNVVDAPVWLASYVEGRAASLVASILDLTQLPRQL